MKLGTALSERSALGKKISELRVRIAANLTINEGETSPEDPNRLLEQADEAAGRLGYLLAQINKTNSTTWFNERERVVITDALAQRDVLNTRIATLEQAAAQAANARGYRFRATELKTVVQVEVPELRVRIEALQEERRLLDARLQQLSWEIDLVEG